jgi:hypothetical protein
MTISPEDVTLIAVFAISYLASMYTQYADPNLTLERSDWVISFLWSFIGGFLAYSWFSFAEENPGKVMAYTIVISIASPRAFKFISNFKNQDRFFESMFNKITNRKKEEDGTN